MPADLFANNASTTLAAGITAAATSLTVASSTGFPVPTSGTSLFRVLCGTEILTVTGASGTTWTVTRGAEGSTAAAHSAGDAVTMVVTAGAIGNLGVGGGDYFASGYYSAGTFVSSTSTAAVNVGQMYLRPFFVPVRRAFDRIGFNVTAAAAAGGVVRLGIYTGAGRPNALLVEAGTVDVTSTGAKEIAISQTLDPGIYWIAYAAQTASPTVTTLTNTSTTPWVSFFTTPPTGALAHGFNASSVPGALPSSPTLTATAAAQPFTALRAT